MRKTLWVFIVLFLFGGTAAFAQEDWDYGVVDPLWYHRLEVVGGFQMGFTMTEDGDFISRPAIVAGFRHYLRPVFRSLVLGYSIFLTPSFPSEMYWKSPDGQLIRIPRNSLNLLWGIGGLAGASLQGRMFGPVGLALDLGFTGNFEMGRGNYSWASRNQGSDFYYGIIDLGLGLNAGMLFDFGRFSLEPGANLGYSLFRYDSFNAYAPGTTTNSLDSGSNTGGANIIRAAPYILIGIRF